jgi:hypothetical protein
MGENTTQVEGLDFTVKDHSTPAAERMAKSFERVSHAAEKVKAKLGSMGHQALMSGLGMVGLSLGFHAIAEKASEANLELTNAAKKIAGVQYTFGGWKAGVTGQEKWAASLEAGTEIVEKLEASESKLKMGRDKLSDIYKSAFALGSRHNLNQAQMIDMTEKLGAAEKVLGVSAEGASMQITRMAMTGKIRGFDDFSKTMRFAIGDLKAFGKLSEEKRFQKIQKAMGDLMPAAEGMGKGLSGAMFDIREAVQDLLRSVTGPVFKEITKDVRAWAHELTKVQESGKSVTALYGEKLLGIFRALKSASAFIADHWKTIAVIWGAGKLRGLVSGGAGISSLLGLVGSAAGAGAAGAGATGAGAAAQGLAVGAGVAGAATTGLATKTTALTGQFGALIGKVSLATEAFAAGSVIGAAIGQYYADWKQDKEVAASKYGEGSNLEAGAAGAAESFQRYKELLDKQLETGMETVEASRQAADAMRQFKGAFGQAIGPKGETTTAAIQEAWKEMTVATREALLPAVGMSQKAAYYTETSGPEFAERLMGALKDLANAMGGPSRKEELKVAQKPDINIHVAHMAITQDFKQADPDRIFHRIPNDIVDMVRSPRSSNLALVTG